MLHSVPNDSLIWQSFKNGDRDSFARIYDLYFKNLYEYGMRLMNNNDLVKDSIHDLFVKVWLNRASLGEVTNVKSYLLVALRGTIYNANARGRNVPLSIDESVDDYDFKMDFSVENDLIKREVFSEQRQKLVDAMNTLSSRQKEMIYLRYFEELSYDEIASILNITVKATYKLSSRAIEALRQILNVSNSSLCILISLSQLRSLN